MDIIESLLNEFIYELNSGNEYKLIPAGRKSAMNYECNIYNEISLQHELGKFLENKLKYDYHVFYEKNMYDTKKEKEQYGWVKKEVDIVIVSKDKEQKEKYAIELKFSKGENARTPENLYDYIKDIKFMELVKKIKEYTNVYNFIIANSQKYYKYELNNNSFNNRYDIYEMFRRQTNDKNQRSFFIPKKPEKIDKYCKPTGKNKGEEFILEKQYSDIWRMLLLNDKDSDKKIFQYRYILINHNKVK